MSRDRVSSSLRSEVVFLLVKFLLNHERHFAFPNGGTLVLSLRLEEGGDVGYGDIILTLGWAVLLAFGLGLGVFLLEAADIVLFND